VLCKISIDTKLMQIEIDPIKTKREPKFDQPKVPSITLTLRK